MRHTLWFIGLLSIAAAPFSAGCEDRECELDSDCEDLSLVCIDERCVSPEEEGEADAGD